MTPGQPGSTQWGIFSVPGPCPFQAVQWTMIGHSLPWELACKTPMLSSNCMDLMLSDAKMHSLSCSDASSILFWLADRMTHMSQRLMLTALRSARLSGVPFEGEVKERICYLTYVTQKVNESVATYKWQLPSLGPIATLPPTKNAIIISCSRQYFSKSGYVVFLYCTEVIQTDI